MDADQVTQWVADYEAAMSWFTAERHVLNASVALAAETDFGFPAWQLALTMHHLYVIFGEVSIRQGKLKVAVKRSRRVLELYREAEYRGGWPWEARYPHKAWRRRRTTGGRRRQ